MKNILNIVLLSIVFSFSFDLLSAQNNRKMDYERLVNDLRIMEGIIDKLLNPSGNNRWYSGGNSQGFYIPDYGVLFSVPISKPLIESLFVFPRIPQVPKPPRASAEFDEEDGAEYAFTFSFSEKEDEKRIRRLEENEKKDLEKTASKISDFFGIYADAIGQISEKDKIAVYLYDSSNQSPEHLFSVSKRDIVEFKSGKIKSKTFNNRIKYASFSKNNELSSQIDIMAYVLNTSMKAPSSGRYNFRMLDNGVNGLYLDGFGALFIVNNRRNSLTNNLFVFDSQLEIVSGELARIDELELYYSDKESFSDKKDVKRKSSERKRNSVILRKKSIERKMEEYRKSIEEYKLSFSTLLGNYGHTLRLVDGSEWIGVITNWQNSIKRVHNTEIHNSLIMKVLKKDVDRFNSGQISKEDFFKKISYIEY